MGHPLDEREGKGPIEGLEDPVCAWNTFAIPEDISIDKNVKIWRYTTLENLLNSLRKSGEKEINLQFTRTTEYEKTDEYEGTVPKASKMMKVDTSKENREKYMKKMYGSAKPEEAPHTGGVYGKMRKLVYLNCWSMGEHESSTMWSAYSNRNSGVAISSTVGDIIESAKNYNSQMYYGRVEYRDYGKFKIPLNTILPFFLKRKEFKRETEFRLAISHRGSSHTISPSEKSVLPDGPSEANTYEPFDIDGLISKIVVHPNSSKHLKKTVEDSLKKYNIDKSKIEHSELRKD